MQSVSNPSSQALSGPSDAVNSAFMSSLTATPTKRQVRPSPLKTPVSASKSKEALLAKAQAIQAGGLFDQTMRAAPDTTPGSASKSRATPSGGAQSALPHSAQANTAPAVEDRNPAARDGDTPSEMQPARKKQRRMGRVVFGLAIHSSLNRLDEEEEANDERRRRNTIVHIQLAIEKLRSSNPTWRYLDAPRDFLVTISPSEDDAEVQ